jgi:peptidoglycan/LPS O-acetylase OafA/YrhL
MWLAAAIVVVTPVARWIWRVHGGSPDRLYDLSWFRFDGLALGAFLAGWVRMPALRPRHSIVLAAGLAALSVIVTAAALPFGVFTTHTAASGALRFTQAQLNFAAALLAAFTFRGTFWTAPLRSGFARMSSKFSYCLYLVHLCVVDLWWRIEQYLGLRPAGVSYASWGVARMAIVLAVSFMIAALSWRYVEQPLLRLKRHLI